MSHRAKLGEMQRDSFSCSQDSDATFIGLVAFNDKRRTPEAALASASCVNGRKPAAKPDSRNERDFGIRPRWVMDREG